MYSSRFTFYSPNNWRAILVNTERFVSAASYSCCLSLIYCTYSACNCLSNGPHFWLGENVRRIFYNWNVFLVVRSIIVIGHLRRTVHNVSPFCR